MKKVIFPGTFDPPTLGHMDIIQRASSIFDYLYVAVGQSLKKPKTAFSLSERIELLKQLTKNFANVEVVSFEGLLVDYTKQLNISTAIRAIRNTSDFDNEVVQAGMNKQLGEIETLYMAANDKFRNISSSLIKEIAYHGKRLSSFVPLEIEEFVFQRLYET